MVAAFVPDDFAYYDLRGRSVSRDIGTLFPGWEPGKERVAVFSPHDDDAVLGPGDLVLAIAANGGEVAAFIACNGCAGYSTPAERETIVATREAETLEAFDVLGIPAERIVRLGFPDFSAWPQIGWQLPGGHLGSLAQTLPKMRALGITRVLIPNGYREHVDHEATARIAAYDVPQVGDPILADWGLAAPVRSLLEYAVWSDFTPEDALVHHAPDSLRANRALVAPAEAEEVVARALRAFRSQQRIIAGLLQQRLARRLTDGRRIELYRWFDPRPALDYSPYRSLVAEMDERR